jgi:ABC-type Fe3+-hydroxamate transport system substrate-binding protein
MMGNTITINYPPRRIVSLVPSQTELLCDLGLGEEVVGITKFCVHPQSWFRSKKRVGGTKTVHTDIIQSLCPDLIIANKEENTKEQIEELSAQFPVWVSDIRSIADGLHMIRAVGELINKEAEAHMVADAISAEFAQLTRPAISKRVAYFIWRKPWMCAGGDTFISNMIETAGWQNALGDRLRYPEIELEELKSLHIDLVLLSSEPYPFKDAHIAEIKAALPGAEALLVDGELFSWYGSRMLKAAGYLKELTLKYGL